MSDAAMRVGIVSTHRAWTSESEAWARYHLSLGFDRIYVFADDGHAHPIPSPLAVALTPCTQDYWASQRTKGWFREYLLDIERDFGSAQWGTPERVVQRQIVNAAEALVRASDEGIDWLLHIDDDEYFWFPGNSIHEHFHGLTLAGIGCSLYMSHEAVVLDERKRRTSFKRNLQALTGAQRSALPSLLSGKPYFLAHEIGKSAGRVTPGTVPVDVHYWFNRALGQGVFCAPGLLHQPYKSVDQFCDKHLSQGEYSTEFMFGRPWTPPGVLARAQLLCRKNDRDGLRSLYSQAVVLSEEEFDRLQAEDYLFTPEVALPIDEGCDAHELSDIKPHRSPVPESKPGQGGT